MESTILRKHVVAQIFSGEPFDMEFVTADTKRKTGGELISVEGWRVLARDTNKGPAPANTSYTEPLNPDGKDLNHDEHGTVVIHNPGNKRQHFTSVHFDLIQFFNGKRVTNG